MRCPDCGSEINDNELFCDYCGAEIMTNIPNAPSKTATAKKTKAKAAKPAKAKPAPKSEDEKEAVRDKLIMIAKIAVAAVLVVIVIIIAISLSVSSKAAEGRRIFEKIPLGRDIDMIETETGTAFLSGKNSASGALNHIADYNYFCESEKSVNVGGIEVPEWAVLLRKNDATVNEAVLYNFNILKHNWMGKKMPSNIELSTIEYGFSLKTAERRLGLKPYTIIKESSKNTSTYVYRYHYVDEETGNTIVKNFFVIVSDVDNQVKDVADEQLDYLRLILKAEQ